MMGLLRDRMDNESREKILDIIKETFGIIARNNFTINAEFLEKIIDYNIANKLMDDLIENLEKNQPFKEEFGIRYNDYITAICSMADKTQLVIKEQDGAFAISTMENHKVQFSADISLDDKTNKSFLYVISDIVNEIETNDVKPSQCEELKNISEKIRDGIQGKFSNIDNKTHMHFNLESKIFQHPEDMSPWSKQNSEDMLPLGKQELHRIKTPAKMSAAAKLIDTVFSNNQSTPSLNIDGNSKVGADISKNNDFDR